MTEYTCNVKECKFHRFVPDNASAEMHSRILEQVYAHAGQHVSKGEAADTGGLIEGMGFLEGSSK